MPEYLSESDDADDAAARRNAILWAQSLLIEAQADPHAWAIFDGETTGLPDSQPEIVQVGILWPDGTVAGDALVKPDFSHLPADRRRIPVAATAIHGITDAMVAGAPTLLDILPELETLLHGRKVIVYNVAFETDILHASLMRRWFDPAMYQAWAMPWTPEQREQYHAVRARPRQWLDQARFECAMHQYAAYIGDYNDHFGGYRFQKLPGASHDAIGDCRAVLALIQRMAASDPDKPTSQDEEIGA